MEESQKRRKRRRETGKDDTKKLVRKDVIPAFKTVFGVRRSSKLKTQYMAKVSGFRW